MMKTYVCLTDPFERSMVLRMSWPNEEDIQALHRMTKKQITLFTSNVKIEDLKHDDRIKNRIEKMAIPIHLPDESVRSTISKKENEELVEVLYG